MSTPQQTALILPARLGKLVLRTIDVPKPKAGEIVVKVQAAGLNSSDWKMYKRGFFITHYPAVLGWDIAGDVVKVGPGVTNVAVGDRVFVQGKPAPQTGAFQQYALVKYPNSLFAGKIPDNLTYEEASTLPLNLLTAYLGFFNRNPVGLALPNPFALGRGKSSGQSIVVLAGSGSVGQFAVQLARVAGFSTIITTSSLRHKEWLISIGATHVIDRHLPDTAVSAEVSKITRGHALKYVFDAVSLPETQQLGYDLLAPGGQILILNPETIRKRVDGKTVAHVNVMVHLPENHEALGVLFKNIAPFLEDGRIEPLRVEVLPHALASIPDGFRRLENRKASGIKLTILPQDTP